MTNALRKIEQDLLPVPDVWILHDDKLEKVQLSFYDKVTYFVCNVLAFVKDLLFLPIDWISSWFTEHEVKVIQPMPAGEEALPRHFGFADSLFQTSGLGTGKSATPLAGKSNWDEWLNPDRIEGPAEYEKYFVDVLRNPDPFIGILREMHVTAHRFSLEWSVIEPAPGQIDMDAVQLYRTFIQKLKSQGIEPYVTLHHFVSPHWFSGFDKEENVQAFQQHALRMMEIFPEVDHWMTFNEPGVLAFQSYVRGVYPPGITRDIAMAASVIRNLLMAHCLIYTEAKKRWPLKQIGITHQWLEFMPLEGNPLERIVCYFLSKITHFAIYDFFKTGKFSLQIPFICNVQFSADQRSLTDFFGVQCYGRPRVKIGFNWGEEYPGYGVVNMCGFTFGATCPPGGSVMSFGPPVMPEELEHCLTEAAALNVPIVISETGCDAWIQKWGDLEFGIHDDIQLGYYQKIILILKRFQHRMKAFFVWTLVRGHLEWDRGDFPRLGVVELHVDERGINFKLTRAALFLQKVFQEKMEALFKAA